MPRSRTTEIDLHEIKVLDELKPERMFLVVTCEGKSVVGMPDKELLAIVEKRLALIR